MTGLSSRWIVVLCLCLLSQQFAPAYTAHLSKNSLVKSKRSEEQEEPDQEEEEENQAYPDDQEDSEDNALQNRGVIYSLAKWSWKALRKTTTAIDKITDVTSVGMAILQGIAGCEGIGVTGISELYSEHKQLYAEYERISDEIDSQIQTAYNMREYGNYSIKMHEEVRESMERLVDEENVAFEAMQPTFAIAITNETSKLEKMIKKKKANGEEVDLLEVDRGYKRGLDLALSIALPSLSLAMPYAAKLFNHLKKGVIGRNIQKLENKFGAFKILSSTPGDKARLLKGYRSLGVKANGARGFSKKLTNIFNRMKDKYSAVKKIVNGIKTGFKLAIKVGSAALKIWNTFETIEDCTTKLADAKDAVRIMKEFLEKNRKLLEDAKTSVQNTKKALEDVYNVAWDSDLLEGLGMIKEMEEEVAISKPGSRATEILKCIEDYKTGSLDNYREWFPLQENLKNCLGMVTTNTRCFRVKGIMRNNVNNDCAKGEKPYDYLYEKEVADTSFPKLISTCRESSGELFITLDKMKMAWEKAVEKNSTVKSVCLMNNKLTVSTIKGKLIDGTTDLSEIAELIFTEGLKLKGVKEEIEAVIKSLPSLNELPLSEFVINTICMMKPIIPDAAKMIKHLRKYNITKRKLSEKLVEDALNNCA